MLEKIMNQLEQKKDLVLFHNLLIIMCINKYIM